jgi:hypothetical protein
MQSLNSPARDRCWRSAGVSANRAVPRCLEANCTTVASTAAVGTATSCNILALRCCATVCGRSHPFVRLAGWHREPPRELELQTAERPGEAVSLILCNECGHQISTDAKACPKCGARRRKTKWWLWILFAAVAAFFLFGAIQSNSPQGKAKAHDRRVIDLCWDEHKRPSLDTGSQRFIASTCEKLEREFVSKYGVNP